MSSTCLFLSVTILYAYSSIQTDHKQEATTDKLVQTFDLAITMTLFVLILKSFNHLFLKSTIGS